MKQEFNRPSTVPKEATWNTSDKEWELGERNKQGKCIGEWKWWLAPNGHLCCHTFFDDNGNMKSFKRFHPNGEVSRKGTFENGKQIEDIYFKSSEPTTEVFAHGITEKRAFKAVMKPDEIISFDYYDKEGLHLNPPIEQKKINSIEDELIPEEELTVLKEKLYEKGKGFLLQQFDRDFYHEEILPMIKLGEQKRMFDKIVRSSLDHENDFIFHQGDLHLSNLYFLNDIKVGVIFVKGNLIVDKTIHLSGDIMQLLLVTGNVIAKNVVTSDFLIVFGDLTVTNCLLGDHSNGFTFVGDNIKSKFFYPDELNFEVLGDIDFTYAFGDSFRLNDNLNIEAFNYNNRKLAEFIPLLHQNIHDAASFESNESLLDNDCADIGFFKYIDRFEFMDYVIANKPVFKAKTGLNREWLGEGNHFSNPHDKQP